MPSAPDEGYRAGVARRTGTSQFARRLAGRQPVGMNPTSNSSGSGLRVLKFGGTSLADAERIERVAAIVAGQSTSGPTIAVVSAIGGVTDALAAVAASAEQGDAGSAERLEQLRDLHRGIAADLASEAELADVTKAMTGLLDRLDELLEGISLVKECSPRTRDNVLSTGERLSSILVAAALRAQGTDAAPCDASKMILTDANFGRAWVDMEATRPRVREHFAQSGPLQVVTGFVAGTADGQTTTLGRGGSDYTATLLGAILDAAAVEIWTDVNGVMSADPRMVREAFSLDSLSYDELMELSHWGARVMHPSAVGPVRERDIPIVIRNTLNPDLPGTQVRADPVRVRVPGPWPRVHQRRGAPPPRGQGSPGCPRDGPASLRGARSREDQRDPHHAGVQRALHMLRGGAG